MFRMTESEWTKEISSGFYDLHLNWLINSFMLR